MLENISESPKGHEIETGYWDTELWSPSWGPAFWNKGKITKRSPFHTTDKALFLCLNRSEEKELYAMNGVYPLVGMMS